MTQATDATMRRIAIVLASLPESVAQRLLGTLPRENQRLIRTALGTLTEVDPLEQRRALDGFASSLRKDKSSSQKSSEAAEIVFSRAAIRNLNERADDGKGLDSAHRHRNHDENDAHSGAPLGFLLDVDDETLVAHLKGEMPQTLAIILASISPSQAARVLPRLDPSVRADAMRRIANLQELPAELIDDIGTQLRTRFASYGNNGTGRRALEAILAEMPQTPAQTSYAPIRNSMATTAPEQPTNAQERLVPAMRQASPPEAASPPQANESAINVAATQAGRLKVAEGTWPEGNTPAQSSANRSNAVAPSSATSPTLRTATPLDSTDATHAYLLSLPIDRLREALGRGETRQALLTLCGLPNTTAEALLASLPRRQAKQVRDQLASLGTLQLRDIDDAKSAIAAIAYESGRERIGEPKNESKAWTPSASRQSGSAVNAAAA